MWVWSFPLKFTVKFDALKTTKVHNIWYSCQHRHVATCVCVLCVCVCVCVLRACVHACVCTYTCVCLCLYVCMCMCLYVSMWHVHGVCVSSVYDSSLYDNSTLNIGSVCIKSTATIHSMATRTAPQTLSLHSVLLTSPHVSTIAVITSQSRFHWLHNNGLLLINVVCFSIHDNQTLNYSFVEEPFQSCNAGKLASFTSA